MSASVEGFFRIHDRASGPMKKMEMQAQRTDKAIQRLGDDLDKKVGNSGQLRQIESTQRKMRSLEQQVDSTGGHRGGGGFRRAGRDVDSFGAALRRAGLNLAAVGKIIRLLKIPALVTALGLLAGGVGALGGALVALTPAVVGAVGALGAMLPKLTQVLGATVALGPAVVGLGLAVTTTKLAFKDMGDALGGNAEALKRLTPAARGFLNTLKMYQPVMEGLRKTAQEGGLFGGLDFALRRGQRAIPYLNSLIGTMSKRLGELARAASIRFTSRGFLQDMLGIGQQGGAMVSAGGRSLINLADALRHVLVAARPFTDWLTRTVEGWSKWILGAAKAGRESGRLGQFFERLRGTMTRFGHIIRNVWNIWQAFSRASRAVGNNLWKSFDNATKRWASFLNSAEGQGRMRSWLARAQRDFHMIWSVITNVTRGLVGLGRAARPAGEILWRAADRASSSWADFTNSVGGQISLSRGFLGIVEFTREFMGLIGEITRALFRLGQSRALIDVTRSLKEGVPTLERFLDRMVTAFAPAFLSLIGEIMRMFMWLSAATGPVVLFLNLLARILGVVNSLVSFVPGLGKVLATAFSVFLLTRFARTLMVILGTLKLIRVAALGALLGGGVAGGGGGKGGGGGGGFPLIFGGGRGGGRGRGLSGLFGRGAGGAPVPTGAHPRMFPTVVGGGGRLGGLGKIGKFGLRGAGGVGGIAALGGSLALGAAFGNDSTVASVGGSALTGAAVGATVGSIVPGVGTVLGGAIGAGLGAGYGLWSSRGGGGRDYGKELGGVTSAVQGMGGDDPNRKQLAKQVTFLSQMSRLYGKETSAAGREAWVAINRELRVRSSVLKMQNQQIAAERAYKMEIQGQKSVARGRMIGRRLAGQFGKDESRMGTADALESMAPRVLSQLSKLKPEGRKVLAEGIVSWGNALKSRRPEVTKQVDAMNAAILESFRKTNRNVEIVNGKILTGSKTQWKGIRGALLSEATLAEDGLSRSFGRIQQMALGQLRSMGYSQAQATSILAGTLSGNVSGTRASMDAAATISPSAFAAPDGRATGKGTGDMGSGSFGGPASVSKGLWDEVQMGQSMGLNLASGYRPGSRVRGSGRQSLHSFSPSRAIDMASGSRAGQGDPKMAAFFRSLVGRPGISELILSPLIWSPSRGLRQASGTALADHWDHVHAGASGGGQQTALGGMGGFKLKAPGVGARGVPGALGNAAAQGMATGLSGALNASWGGWYGGGGKFRANRPTIIGVGDRDEDVTITPRGKGRSMVFQPTVRIDHIDYHGDGDISTVVGRELERAFEEFSEKVENGGLVSEAGIL